MAEDDRSTAAGSTPETDAGLSDLKKALGDDIESPDALAEWLMHVVKGWEAEQEKVNCTAIAGRRFAESREDEDAPIEATLFGVIEDYSGSTENAQQLIEGLQRLAAMANTHPQYVTIQPLDGPREARHG